MRAKKKKNKTVKDIIFSVLFWICLCVFIASASLLAKDLYKYYKGQAAYKEMRKEANIDKAQGINWQELQGKYPDVKAWIMLNGTKINYPVVQGNDNAFYLNHMANKEYNEAGSIFVDNRTEHPFNQFLTIVYGHTMKDGSMFHDLRKYREKDGFYKEHENLELFTPEGNYKLEVFSIAKINEEADFYSIANFGDDEESKEEYIREVKSVNSNPDLDPSKISVSPEDKIIMLSTCTAQVDENREVVWAKMIPEN